MEAQLGPCLPPLSCHPGVEWTVPEVDLGLLFLLTGLVLGHHPHPHHPHQFEMASKTHLAKMSGKAGSTSIRFLTYRLQSHMCQQPRRIPAKWPEMKAEVDPTEEKGAPHPFLPSRGDLCLLRSTQTSKAASVVAVWKLHATRPLSLPPSERGGGRNGSWGGNPCVWGWGSGKKGLFMLYIFLSYCLCQLQPARVGCWDR